MAWREVLNSQDVAEGQGIEVLHQGNIIAVFRHRGDLYAIDGLCMHQGGPLARGKVADGTIQCPWHGWMYALATGKNAVTGQPMLRCYPVQEIDGKIAIDLGT
ncbi:MAG: Rieske (2Fe-2S) protein [Planctomycetota bacterium]|jgi:nitrite reductase (NADH) small subunit